MRHPLGVSTCTMPGVVAWSASFRLARPCTTAHASTAPVSASGTTCSAPDPYPTHASLVMPARGTPQAPVTYKPS